MRILEHRKGKGQEENLSALFKHEKLTRHRVDYNNVEILDQANSDKKLLLKELLYIKRHTLDLNVQKELKLISLII